MGYNDTEFGALKMFFLRACAMFIEDTVQEFVKKYRGTTMGRPGIWGRVLGYVYVLVFACWSWRYWVFLLTKTTYAEEVGDYGIISQMVKYLY